MSNNYNNHDWCFLARIVLEAATSMKIGSGRDNIKTDAVILRDANGLPYIPATTIQGIMRHALEAEKDGKAKARRIMGFQTVNHKDEKQAHGSWLSISEAKLVTDSKGTTIDGLLDPDTVNNNEYLSGFREMPIRQHARITDKGTAADKGKFDEEIIPTGTRFCFEMELRGDKENGEKDFDKLLATLQYDTFRIGGGTRKGFGKIKILNIGYKALNLTVPNDFNAYLEKSSSLEKPWAAYDLRPNNTKQAPEDIGEDDKPIHYQLKLKPADFIFFSSGLGDEKGDVDMTIVEESFVVWEESGKPHWAKREESFIVPATSFKGTIAHRTAFYYNMFTKKFADELNKEEADAVIGNHNKAIQALFGTEGEVEVLNKDKEKVTKSKRRGHVLFSDIICARQSAKPKVLNHIKIDRFTGGTIQGALFNEESLYAKDEIITLEVTLLPDENTKQEHVKEALEEALKDVCRGILPLGGGVNRGNGTFKGELYINSKKEEL